MRKRMKLLGLALGIAALLTLVLGNTVFADGPADPGVPAYCNGSGWCGARGYGVTVPDTVSDLLGLTPEELHDLRQEGNSLAQIAEANGISVDELVEAIMAEKIDAVEARVAEGTLTREQADLMIQRMTERTVQAVNRTSTGPAEWRMGGGNGYSGGGACFGSTNRWGGRGSMGGGNRAGSGVNLRGFGTN